LKRELRYMMTLKLVEGAMKALMLSAAAAALGVAAPVSASVTRIGNSLAVTCYTSSLQRVVTTFSLRECDRALEEEILTREDRVATFVNRGIIRMNLGMYPSAEKDFDTAIALDATEADAWLNKGLLRLRQERPADAIRLIDRSLILEPAIATFARGVAHEKMGQLRAAYDDYVRARELDPDWPLPGRELARFQVQKR
jgi:tetratricopeptide (TPR) repeat protein